jgi:hypothetical protein
VRHTSKYRTAKFEAHDATNFHEMQAKQDEALDLMLKYLVDALVKAINDDGTVLRRGFTAMCAGIGSQKTSTRAPRRLQVELRFE